MGLWGTPKQPIMTPRHKLQPPERTERATERKDGGNAERLAAEEARIERGLVHFLEVGQALRAIKEHQLWFRIPSVYRDWKHYLETRWHMSTDYASKLMAAADVVAELQAAGFSHVPTTESQARPLAGLPTEKAAEAWNEVTSALPVEAITAAAIEKVAAKHRKPKKARLKKPAAVKVKGKGWTITIERAEASIDVETILFEAIDRLKPAPAAKPEAA
jgi:hypothetical protein